MPSGAKARFAANVEALRLTALLRSEGRPATRGDQEVLAKWSGWGALSEVFDDSKAAWEAERAELRTLLTDSEWLAAERTTINAHYTDPAYAQQMWRALVELGFGGGRVLEPGSGSGTFIGLAPESAQMVGVELDPVTARIAAALYPQAEIRAESFADTRLPVGSFDAVIGNVPFADVRLHDPVHNAGRHSMHNHFIIKSLALTRPGGIVAVLSSHYTLDSQNPAARREINQMADLLGAVRLPSGAHRRTAGTDAITDLLVFRRREPDRPPVSDMWELVTPVAVGDKTVKVNSYFAQHPDHILGSLELGRGMYRDDSLLVTGDLQDVGTSLSAALGEIVSTSLENGLAMTPRPAGHDGRPIPAPEPASSDLWDGSIVEQGHGRFHTVVAGALEPLKVPQSAARELRALLGLRDAATRLLDLEAVSAEDTPELDAVRARLRGDYETYVRRYGPLGRFMLRRTGRRDADGNDTYARIIPTPIRVLRSDPFGPVVVALERFDEQDQTASPAAILTQRVVVPRAEVLGVETPTDAVAVSLDQTGTVDLDLIARLLGTTPDEAREGLGELVFTDPDTNGLVHAPEYLSGDVRSKLDAASKRALTDPEFQRNATALREVLPEDLGVEEITAQLGAVWISPEIHRQFLAEILKASDVIVENPLPGMWEVRGGRWGVLATSEWGTERRPAPAIAQAVMEQKTLLVYDEHEDATGTKHRVLNPVETAAAQEKAEALQERFAEWVWEDPERAQELVTEYNRRFNSIVLRDYSDAGGHLTLPGLAASFTPLPHQLAAVARMIAEPSAGLFHSVGAGKTAEMVIGAMEMRRIGLVRKPVVVVPNHMREQFTREWLQLYPRARILAASSQDLTKDRRRVFVARAAANDWDAVLLTQGAFAKIPISPETEGAYIDRQVDQVREVLHSAQGDNRKSVKRIQRHLLKLEAKLKARTDVARDAGIHFEQTGIDYLIVDEIHMYKNLATDSNIRDAAIEGSERATDLHMKLEYLRSTGRTRIATGATATPISNSITEAFVMQRYLRPDLLDAAGIGTFDAWAATFGTTVTQMEMAPTGNGFRLKTRFASFRNVPEMLRMWSVFADVKTAEDLQLKIPALATREDGQRAPQTIAVPPTVELEEFVAQLGERADRIAAKQVTPDDDNMLAVSTDGRKAALDIRLVIPDEPSGLTKIDVAADNIYRIWESTAHNTYLDPVTGEPSLIAGSLQLVFSDIGTPSERWNAYDELHLQLVERGIPADMVRYIHDAKTDVDKARLFAAARGGHIAVLIGSTGKMGVGTNVQARAVAAHHLDCPWRPSDIEQREGRIIRQGNQHPEVAIIRYVTERSFDGYMWQGVERKARFITQVMRGSLDSREIDEIDATALTAAEAKAISSGNPLLLEQSTAQAEVARLQRLERAYAANQARLNATRKRADEDAARANDSLAKLQAALPQLVDTSGDNFRIILLDAVHTSRPDAASALVAWAEHLGLPHGYAPGEYEKVGSISGYDIEVAFHRLGTRYEVNVRLGDVPGSQFTLDRATFLQGGVGLVQRIENRAAQIPGYIEQARRRLDETQATIAETDQRIGKPFQHAAALKQAQVRLAEVTQQLAELSTSRNDEHPAAAATTSVNHDAKPATRLAALEAFGVEGDGDQQLPPSRVAAIPSP